VSSVDTSTHPSVFPSLVEISDGAELSDACVGNNFDALGCYGVAGTDFGDD
jgi:hypothetical protein